MDISLLGNETKHYTISNIHYFLHNEQQHSFVQMSQQLHVSSIGCIKQKILIQ